MHALQNHAPPSCLTNRLIVVLAVWMGVRAAVRPGGKYPISTSIFQRRRTWNNYCGCLSGIPAWAFRILVIVKETANKTWLVYLQYCTVGTADAEIQVPSFENPQLCGSFGSYAYCREFCLPNFCFSGSFNFIFQALFKHNVACVITVTLTLTCNFTYFVLPRLLLVI